jgi:hypothetical protein
MAVAESFFGAEEEWLVVLALFCARSSRFFLTVANLELGGAKKMQLLVERLVDATEIGHSTCHKHHVQIE